MTNTEYCVTCERVTETDPGEETACEYGNDCCPAYPASCARCGVER